MSPDDITPERLDAIMDGSDALTDAERELLFVASQLRAAIPAPSDDLRRRVAALGEPAGRPTVRTIPRRRRTLMPALGAVLAVLVGAVAFTVNRDGDSPNNDATLTLSSQQQDGGATPFESSPKQTQEVGPGRSAAESLAAGEPYNWSVPEADAAAALDALQDAATQTGAVLAITRTDVTRIVVTLPDDKRANALRALADALRKAGAVGAPLAPAPDQDSVQIDLRTVPTVPERP